MEESRRLISALCASCALHGALLFVLDARSRVSPPQARSAALLDVRIVGPAAIQADAAAAEREAAPMSVFLSFLSAAAEAGNEALPATVLPAPAALEYLPAERLDTRPVPLGDIDVYPSFLGTYSGEGVVVLVLFIGSTGRVDKIEVESSNLPPIFAETATDAFRRATFTPGMKDGQAANSRVRIEISYEYLNRR